MEPVWTPCPDPPFFLPPPLFLLCFSYCFRINPAWFTYRFRILSVLFPLLEARMIEQRKKEEKGRAKDDTGTIRDWYETDTRRIDFRLRRKVSILTFSSWSDRYYIYILSPCHAWCLEAGLPARRLSWLKRHTKIAFRPPECKTISMN